MKFLLLLLLMFCQEPLSTESLISNLDNDDLVTREAATKQLIEREKDLDLFKSLVINTTNLEVKGRLTKIIETISANQKFRSMSTVSPLITIKFSGDIKDLFAKLAEITGYKLDARAFGDNKVTVDYVDAPLFKILDEASKQAGYDWEIARRDAKGDYIDAATGTTRTPPGTIVDYTTSIDLAGVGMSSKTPSHTGSGFKMQATQTSISINNRFGEVSTECAIGFRYAVDPGIHYAVGPKIQYTKIVTDQGINIANRSELASYCLIAPPATTKNISVAGKATYRIPMKVETIALNVAPIYSIKPDANGNSTMDFAENQNFSMLKSGYQILIYSKGDDYKMKERFLGKFEVKDKNDKVLLGNRDAKTGNGYLNTGDDQWSFYIYGSNGTPFEVDTVNFDFITEFRDISFDFAIDNIPLY